MTADKQELLVASVAAIALANPIPTNLITSIVIGDMVVLAWKYALTSSQCMGM